MWHKCRQTSKKRKSMRIQGMLQLLYFHPCFNSSFVFSMVLVYFWGFLVRSTFQSWKSNFISLSKAICKEEIGSACDPMWQEQNYTDDQVVRITCHCAFKDSAYFGSSFHNSFMESGKCSNEYLNIIQWGKKT